MSKDDRPLVYFSYRLKGSQEHALRLVEWLRKRPLSVELFADADIPPGANWPSVLQEGLDRASAILIFIDADWLHYQDEWGRRRIDNAEDWVHRELHHALSRAMPVLPILVEDARMPPKQALPEMLQALPEIQGVRLRLDHFEEDARSILSWVEALPAGDPTTRSDSRLPLLPESPEMRIVRLEISGFRCFDHLEIDFAAASTLPGNWTCVAGINGAGKSSILQAISLLLMGPDFARELGGPRLQTMRRRTTEGLRQKSVLKGWFSRSGEEHYVELILRERGPSAPATDFWDTADDVPAAGYGASRNLSDGTDRGERKSDTVEAHISLFDPMARLVRAEALLHEDSRSARHLFQQLVEHVFKNEDVRVEDDEKSIRFSVTGTQVSALDLPDGFRSSAAWMADLCVRFQKARPSISSIDQIAGIVLLDEIDLHLHASLQRAIVPRLREALPNVQFIVSSHSPLIISSFDRNELVLLDRSRESGVRPLDRQILGFSTNEVYDWLMETEPRSAALDQALRDGTDPDLAVLLYQSPEYSEKQAKQRHERQKELLREMGYQEGDEV